LRKEAKDFASSLKRSDPQVKWSLIEASYFKQGGQ